MNLSGDVSLSSILDEDILIKRLLLMHDPDGRRLDSELLLHLTKNIMCYSGLSQVPDSHLDVVGSNDISDIEIRGSEETTEQILCKIQFEMLCQWPREGNLRIRTMSMFNLLECYNWDAKVVLTLAAFAMSYAQIWLTMQLYAFNPLAASMAVLRQIPSDLKTLRPRLRALDFLFKNMVEVASSIIKFESLRFGQVNLDVDMMATTKSSINIAAYWVIRSCLACSSIITDIKSLKPEYSSSTVLATWELRSLECRLIRIHNRLVQQVDSCHRQMEERMQQKLLNIFREPHTDNQEVLNLILALKSDLPLKTSSGAKLGVSELKDQVVPVLVSKAELLPLEALLLLVHQTYDHPYHKNLAGTYQILWLPISTTGTWTDAEAKMFNILSNSLPWLSVRQPWSLSPVVVNYIKQQWDYKEEPIIVVLDSRGMVTNTNAIDMLFIWGAKAYPFSSSIEKQMWEREKWTLQLLLDEIDPLLTTWVEEGQKICIYGTNNLEWYMELNDKLNRITCNNQLQLQMLDFGHWHQKQVISVKMHAGPVTPTKMHFFWLRLESMRRSLLRLEQATDPNSILKEISAMLENRHDGWLVMGEGNTTEAISLHGREAIECLTKCSEGGGENMARLGFIGALRAAIEPEAHPTPPAQPCHHTSIVPYNESLIEGTVKCDKCKRPVKLFVVYE